MSAPMKFKHTLEDGLETYAFDSALHDKYKHLVDRIDDEPWEIWPVDCTERMSFDNARTYAREVEALIAFVEELNNQPDLRRSTEPGSPAFEETI